MVIDAYDPFAPNLGVTSEEVDELRFATIGDYLISDLELKDADPQLIGSVAKELVQSIQPNENIPVKKRYAARLEKLGSTLIERLNLETERNARAVGYFMDTGLERGLMPLVTLIRNAYNPNRSSYQLAQQICEKYQIDLNNFFRNSVGDGERKIINTEQYKDWTHLPPEVVNHFVEQDAEELAILEEKGISRQDLVDRMTDMIKNVGNARSAPDLKGLQLKMRRAEDRLCPFPGCGKVDYVGDADIADTNRAIPVDTDIGYTDTICPKLRLNSLLIHLLKVHGMLEKGDVGDNTQQYPTSAIDFHEEWTVPFQEAL